MKIRGTLFLYSETGTEGGYWAIQDERFITPRGIAGGESWSYDGLYALNDGDYLKIFNPDDSIRWEGEIKLKQYPAFTESVGVHDEGANVNLGLWIHADQIGMSRHDWAYPFMKEYKGELTRGE